MWYGVELDKETRRGGELTTKFIHGYCKKYTIAFHLFLLSYLLSLFIQQMNFISSMMKGLQRKISIVFMGKKP